MVSQKQLEANRENAQKSTGPKSEQGKSKVAKNAITHGFTANTPLIPGEDPNAYNTFKSDLYKELNPTGPTEKMLADRIIDLSWRLKRSGRLHISAYKVFSEDARPKQGSSGILPESKTAANSNMNCEKLAVRDFAGDKVFERLLVHERRIENSLFKTITELQRLQFIRTKYQSLIMDREDYDDWEMRELSIRQKQQEIRLEHQEHLKQKQLEATQNQPPINPDGSMNPKAVNNFDRSPNHSN